MKSQDMTVLESVWKLRSIDGLHNWTRSEVVVVSVGGQVLLCLAGA